MFEQKDGCINEWEVLWHERVSRFGEEQEGEVKRFVDVRWLGEPRKVSPSLFKRDERVDRAMPLTLGGLFRSFTLHHKARRQIRQHQNVLSSLL